ncbi:NAD(P)-dependent oxidoreductase [Denitrificimonas sp. JX-1]|uniref:NAD(P)-dependent oxidoreductase n=1 Tax=Denitrificimonas halotolerans TaxID=3098930 RepID=A0ABU5GPB0_9GAMM|nr:NAD(P)-dependent oxidoreductase [Denitrificimonas sp. JX-1]MDY7218811.1 NAD(P)-dependent oxidoreductase [Denitrificimonas sp. JX-1]
MKTSLPRLAFAGIGLMGLPMCKRLLAAGYPLVVWNRNPDKCAPLVALGAQQVHKCADLAAQTDIIFLCLADTAAVQDVMYGEHGLATVMQARQILVDFSSIEPEATRAMAQKLLDECGAQWLDVPVSGGVGGAEAGTLAMMAGGNAEALAQVTSVLEQLGQSITHVGGVGAGQVTKVCNQMLVACNTMVIAEVVGLAEKAGVDAALLASALAGGFADSKPLQILAPQMATRTFEPVKWHVRTLLKDLDIAVKLSQSHTSSTPMSGLAAQLMRSHAAQGHLADDPATLIKLYCGDD